MKKKLLRWKDIGRLWDPDEELDESTGEEAYDKWQKAIKHKPELGFEGNEWDEEDFRMWIAYLYLKYGT